MTYEELSDMYHRMFSIGTNTSGSYKEKIELITSICFLTKKLEKKDYPKYKNTYCVLQAIFGKERMESDLQLQAISLLCDDFRYGCKSIPNLGYKTSKEVIEKIKILIEQTLPF